jgi:hypothetical protein
MPELTALYALDLRLYLALAAGRRAKITTCDAVHSKFAEQPP